MNLVDFVRDSNFIEGIHREPTAPEIKAHEDFLALPEIRVVDLENFVNICAGRPLRDKLGMNVRVGDHRPPEGGPAIRLKLVTMLIDMHEGIDSGKPTPHQWHKAYETLHPFMDGNGRSGRVLWAWHHKQLGNDPFVLEFLRLWYYESLAESQGR